MILYRLQISADTSWTVEWYGTKAEALSAFQRAIIDVPRDLFLDELDVPTTGRDAIAAVLNRAQVERSNWSGECLKKHTGKNARLRPTMKELL